MCEIDNLLQYGEHIVLECKKAKNDLPKSVWETYSSFANTNGGDILLGIEENKDEMHYKERFTVTGVNDADKIINDFWSVLNSPKVSVNILKDSDVVNQEIDGKTIVCIHIPQAKYTQRPVYINNNPIKGTFKRNHEGDYHCTEDEVKAMLRDASDSGNVTHDWLG